jgi:hypothetical protein
MEVNRGVLAELEGLEAIHDERLGRGLLRTKALVKQQAVSSESRDLLEHRCGRDPEVARDLTVPRACQHTHERRPEEVRTLEPIGRGEGL